MWSQNRDDCGLKRLVLWVATGNGRDRPLAVRDDVSYTFPRQQ